MSLIGTRRFSTHVNLAFITPSKRITAVLLTLIQREKIPLKKILVKLRIGCRNLRVETGRYDKIPLDERICLLCSGNKIEGETNLLLDRQRHSSMRDIFLSKIETKFDDIRKLSHENLIIKTDKF